MPEDPTEITDEIEVSRPPNRLLRSLKRLVRWGGLFIALLGLGLFAASIALLFPYVRDDLKIDGIVRTVALDWRDFGRAKADERLRFEFSQRRIGRHTSAADCSLIEGEAGRQVLCEWGVRLRLGRQTLPLAFESSATITPTGDLTAP